MSKKASLRKMGRPSKYKPEYCQRVIELGKEGKQTVQIACALDVSKATIMEWAVDHEEFSIALARSRALCEQWYVEKLQERITGGNPGCSDSLLKFALSAAHGWREKSDTTSDITMKSKIELDFGSRPDDSED